MLLYACLHNSDQSVEIYEPTEESTVGYLRNTFLQDAFQDFHFTK